MRYLETKDIYRVQAHDFTEKKNGTGGERDAKDRKDYYLLESIRILGISL